MMRRKNLIACVENSQRRSCWDTATNCKNKQKRLFNPHTHEIIKMRRKFLRSALRAFKWVKIRENILMDSVIIEKRRVFCSFFANELWIIYYWWIKLLGGGCGFEKIFHCMNGKLKWNKKIIWVNKNTLFIENFIGNLKKKSCEKQKIKFTMK
jgi:hypothetical protein